MARQRYRSNNASPEQFFDADGNEAPPEWYARQAQKWVAKYLERRKPGRPEDAARNRKILEAAQQHRHADGTPNITRISDITGASRKHISGVIKRGY